MPGAAGLYEIQARSNVCVARSRLDALPQLLATLAHELAHELLLKGGHLTQETADHEHVTDLLPVFLGTGVFLANATVQSASERYGNWYWSSISKQGYLSSITLGYALALFAFARGEGRPPWAAHLRTDAAATLRAGLGYLRKTGDSLFHPDTLGKPAGVPGPEDVKARLAHRSPTVRLAALWDVAEHGSRRPTSCRASSGAWGTGMRTCCVGRPGHGGVRGRGGRCRPPIDRGRLLRHAAGAGGGRPGSGRSRPPPGRPCRRWCLCSGTAPRRWPGTAAGGLARFGRAAAAAEPGLLSELEAAAMVADLGRLGHLTAALRAVSPNATAQVSAQPRGPRPGGAATRTRRTTGPGRVGASTRKNSWYRPAG